MVGETAVCSSVASFFCLFFSFAKTFAPQEFEVLPLFTWPRPSGVCGSSRHQLHSRNIFFSLMLPQGAYLCLDSTHTKTVSSTKTALVRFCGLVRGTRRLSAPFVVKCGLLWRIFVNHAFCKPRFLVLENAQSAAHTPEHLVCSYHDRATPCQVRFLTKAKTTV